MKHAPGTYALSFQTRVLKKSYISRGSSVKRRKSSGSRGGKVGLGGYIFTDRNGAVERTGFKGTYAYHLNFGNEAAMNQLSFGLSFMYSQNSVNQNDFIAQDPLISQGIESSGYYNVDFSLGYHFLDSFSYFTIKNLLLTPRDLVNNSFESDNLRRYLLTFGYYLGRGKKFQFEPSVMLQYIEYTGEAFMDLNVKAYKNIGNKSQIWAALSYRQNFDSNIQSLKMITPILGINYKRFMFSYTYTSQIGDVVLTNSGNHQVTLGFNVFCNKPRSTGCPNLNSTY